MTQSLADVSSGMESAFYAVFAIYLLGMFLLAIRGFLLKRSAKASAGVEAEMNYHFLAGSAFGPVVLFLNFCAQYIGGIVMVATPNDSRSNGYVMLMWISGCSWCGGTFNLCGPRLREVMRGRNYLSPNDYLTDRYRSSWISLLGVCSSTFQMIMITGLEWLSLQKVLAAILGPDADTDTWVWLLGMFIFVCECLGGMASVALTDAIQAGLLLFTFFMLPIITQHHWGGFEGIGGADCQNREVANSLGPVGAMGLGSPFDVYGTDACYRNSNDDVANGCAMPLQAIAPNPSEFNAGDAFPMSFIAFAFQVPVAPWNNIAHEFGVKTAEQAAIGSRYRELCKMNTNCVSPMNASTCVGTTTTCPPAGTKFMPLVGDINANYNMASSHHQLSVTCTGTNNDEVCAYGKVAANAGNFTYTGKLVFKDGTEAYTGVKMSSTQSGCVSINMASFWHFKYPPQELVATMFGFGFMWIPFALAPVSLHRVMTAKDADSLRISLSVLHLFPITFFLPVILLGITAGAVFPADTTYAFPLMAFEIAKTSGFGSFISVICLTACMASFMSTADSIVICGSLLFTVDVYYNLYKKGKVAVQELMIVTKAVSMFMIVTGICIALYTDLDFIEMLWIGNGILGNLVPVYIGLFFHQIRSFEVFVAMIMNLFGVFLIQCIRWYPAVDCPEQVCLPKDGGNWRAAPALPFPLGFGDPDELYLWFLPPFYGMLMGTAALIIVHFLCKVAPFNGLQGWFDKLQGIPVEQLAKFGKQRLDLDRTGEITMQLCAGMKEPIADKNAWFFLAFPFIAPLALPWWKQEYGACEAVGGLPKWAFDFTIVNSIGTGCLMITCIFFWKGRPANGVVAIKEHVIGPEAGIKEYVIGPEAGKNQVVPMTVTAPTTDSAPMNALENMTADDIEADLMLT